MPTVVIDVSREESFVSSARRRPASGKRGGRPPSGPQRKTAGTAPGTRTPPPARAGSVRAKAERHTALPLIYLTRLPRWVPFLVVLVLAIVALFAPGIGGAAALFVLAVLFAWLAYVSWPALTASGRTLRLAAVGMIIAAGVLKAQ